MASDPWVFDTPRDERDPPSLGLSFSCDPNLCDQKSSACESKMISPGNLSGEGVLRRTFGAR